MKNPYQILGGIFDKHNIETKLEELEKTLLKENFWKDKELVKKTVKQKKIFEEILASYKNSTIEIKNLKELFDLAIHEKNDEIINECNLKIDQISQKIKKVRLIVFYLEKMMTMEFT